MNRAEAEDRGWRFTDFDIVATENGSTFRGSQDDVFARIDSSGNSSATSPTTATTASTTAASPTAASQPTSSTVRARWRRDEPHLSAHLGDGPT
jgi:hypothetical protein